MCPKERQNSNNLIVKPGFQKTNFDYDNNQFLVKTKRLVGKMTAQQHNPFVFWVVVVEFAVNGKMETRHYSMVFVT